MTKKKKKKSTQEPFRWPCCFSHWLYLKGVSPARAALIYGHLKWSLTPLFCFYVLCRCQPFQQSLLFWNWSSCGWKEVWFVWFQSFSDLFLCVCNNHRRSWSSRSQYNIFHNPLEPSLSACYYFFVLTILVPPYPYWKICKP